MVPSHFYIRPPRLTPVKVITMENTFLIKYLQKIHFSLSADILTPHHLILGELKVVRNLQGIILYI